MCNAIDRNPVYCILPPYMLEHIALQKDPSLRALVQAARQNIVISDRLRRQRVTLGALAQLVLVPTAQKQRTIYTARNGRDLPGEVVRKEGDPPSSDVAVDEAYDGLGSTYDLFATIYERNSIDDRGMQLDATVHYQQQYDNAFWNGRQMVFGDGDGKLFERFTRCIDVIGHELTHGVTQHEADLEYDGQSGALNEHCSDVFGSLVKQFVLKQSAARADWLIGEGLFTAAVKGRAIRSMKEPGTAYDDPVLGKDPQPGHMRDYYDGKDDNGGVHINSGIPNRAFYLAASRLGGNAWSTAGRVWYLVLRDHLGSRSQFRDAAELTVAVAGEELGVDGANVVRDAWKEVGVVSKPSRAAGRTGATRKGKKNANQSRAKRGVYGNPKGKRRRDR